MYPRILPELLHLGPVVVFGHSIGPIYLHSFGLLLALAFVISGHLYALELKRRGLDPELSGLVVTWAILGALIGARLYYLAEFWDEVKGNLLAAAFSGSGLVAYGGFAGGIVLSWLALRRRGVPVLEASDAAAPVLALGYAIGRIGCLLAGDGDYGGPSDLPWAMAFPNGAVPVHFPVHPTPAYETLWMLGVFAVLWQLRLRSWPVGRMFALYVVLQGVERFVIEFWRRNPIWGLGLSGAQFIAAASILVGLAWLFRLRGLSREPKPARGR